MGTNTLKPAERFAQFFSAADDSDNTVDAQEFALPEDLTQLSDEEVETLHTEAVGHFEALYGDGTAKFAGDALTVLNELTGAIEALSAERVVREEKAAALAAEAAELAAKVKGTLAKEVVEEIIEDEEDEEEGNEKLSQKRVIKLPARSSSQARQSAETAAALQSTQGIEDVLIATGEGLGLAPGTGTDFMGMGKALDNRLKTFNLTQYQNAKSVGRSIREMNSLASIRNESAFQIRSNDRTHIDDVIKSAAAIANHKMPTSLVASGGWHAASETLYNEFLQLEATGGGLSTPEVTLVRGGAQITPGVSFADIFAAVGFDYTEDEDILASDPAEGYDGEGGGKPAYFLEVPDFTDYRLDVHGLIIEAGLLAARGYPEYLADVIRKALVAHFHKMNAAKIADIAAGSTEVTIPATQAGATAPILSGLELQAAHYRDTHRMLPNAVLEVVAPFWVVSLIRADLSRRLGVDLISVPDARVLGWFTERNLAPQFVQDYQSIATTATASFTAWPTTAQFLMYAAGTWVAGKSDVITLDTLYDSVNLKQNNFTALFTEEGQSMLKVGTDSRKINFTISADGATHGGVDIAHNGTAA